MKYTTTLFFPTLAVAVGVNPDTTFDPATNKGDFGPGGNGFTPFRNPSPQATGAPQAVSNADAIALQNAADSWSIDTGTVSNFQDNGKKTQAGNSFNALANGAFVAEVDELVHKAILDTFIGNDPQVSIANLTFTNGVFQSVVNNLQIMSVQGKDTQELIDQINAVRCTQILPSIDTYFAVAARVIGEGATLRKAIRPAACAAILQQNAENVDAFPNVPNVPGGTPLGQQDAATGGTGAGNGNGGAGNTGGNAGAGKEGTGNTGGGNARNSTATATRGGADAGNAGGGTATASRGGAGAGSGGAATPTSTIAASGRAGQGGRSSTAAAPAASSFIEAGDGSGSGATNGGAGAGAGGNSNEDTDADAGAGAGAGGNTNRETDAGAEEVAAGPDTDRDTATSPTTGGEEALGKSGKAAKKGRKGKGGKAKRAKAFKS
ncbi:hypothetical protein EJ08DRAFT_250344 [Tothia fuscella]|uniref:Uncharacterized protein n=1 Tax=Tothia fuscella TaxID=1048955 RepID=A0A9P4NRE1_9PEZI|nr:hypothetical protein EJ08DRAFT_250344 [Tothia fuscella]